MVQIIDKFYRRYHENNFGVFLSFTEYIMMNNHDSG